MITSSRRIPRVLTRRFPGALLPTAAHTISSRSLLATRCLSVSHPVVSDATLLASFVAVLVRVVYPRSLRIRHTRRTIRSLTRRLDSPAATMGRRARLRPRSRQPLPLGSPSLARPTARDWGVRRPMCPRRPRPRRLNTRHLLHLAGPWPLAAASATSRATRSRRA